VQEPGLILADEPFAAVDPVTTEGVMEALLELNRGGATLLINLHDVDLARRFPRIVALREGRVAYDGEPNDLTDELLAAVYEGDGRRAGEREERVPRAREPVRVAEGRDGVSAH
jgi:phosphonate transport system ATP-binding protein